MSPPRARVLGAPAGYQTGSVLVGRGELYPRILKSSMRACRFMYILRAQLLESRVSVV